MAHSCPECGHMCHCGGDIDIDAGDDLGCEHCDTEGDPDDWWTDDDEEDPYDGI